MDLDGWPAEDGSLPHRSRPLCSPTRSVRNLRPSEARPATTHRTRCRALAKRTSEIAPLDGQRRSAVRSQSVRILQPLLPRKPRAAKIPEAYAGRNPRPSRELPQPFTLYRIPVAPHERCGCPAGGDKPRRRRVASPQVANGHAAAQFTRIATHLELPYARGRRCRRRANPNWRLGDVTPVDAERRHPNPHRSYRSDRGSTADATPSGRAGVQSRSTSLDEYLGRRSRRGRMSNGLAIAGVTAVLQYYLHEPIRQPAAPNSPFTSTVNVSCLAPDLVQQRIVNTTAPSRRTRSIYFCIRSRTIRPGAMSICLRGARRQRRGSQSAAGPRSPLPAYGVRHQVLAVGSAVGLRTHDAARSPVLARRTSAMHGRR